MNRAVVALLVGVLVGWFGARFEATWRAGESEAPARNPMGQPLPELPEPYYTVLFENDAVRIVDHRLEPGAIEPEHTHPPMAAYFVEGATLRITEAGGATRQEALSTGDFVSVPDWWTHALENTGKTPLHSVLVEFKAR